MVYIAKPEPSLFRCSAKQQEVMRHVLESVDGGAFLTLKGLNDLISWGPIRPVSLSMIVRHLEAHGFVKRLYGHPGEKDVHKMLTCAHGEQEKVRGLRMFIIPTPFAYSFFRPSALSSALHPGEL